MSILVTGGAGFVGSNFVELLAEKVEDKIVCIDNFNDFYDSSIKRNNICHWNNDIISVVEGDFCDNAFVDELFQLNSFTRIVHLGAYASVRRSVENPYMYQKSNVDGTLNLLEASRKYGVKRFVFSSSSTVYGDAKTPFVEDNPLGTIESPYGVTKRAAELFCLTYHKLHRVPVVCVRPFSIYGPRLRPDLAMSVFAKAICEDEIINLYGNASRDFTHVSDVCDGVFSALYEENIEGEIINLGNGSAIEMERVIELLEECFDKKAIIKKRPAREEDATMTCADLTKAERILGYRPKILFEDGICEYVKWFKQSSSS